MSVNIPPSRSIGNFQADSKEGTVGRCVPDCVPGGGASRFPSERAGAVGLQLLSGISVIGRQNVDGVGPEGWNLEGGEVGAVVGVFQNL